MRVLVADDAPTMAALVARAVAAAGHETVAVAGDDERALALAVELAPDAIVLDARLANDGPALVARLAAAAPGARLLVVAALAELELLRRCIAAGAAGGVRRPIVASEIAEALAGR